MQNITVMPRKTLYQKQDGDLIFDGPSGNPDDRNAGNRSGSGDGTVSDKQYVLRLRDLPTEDKPREKLMKHGPAILSLTELIAIILNVGTTREDVLAMSRRLMKE